MDRRKNFKIPQGTLDQEFSILSPMTGQSKPVVAAASKHYVMAKEHWTTGSKLVPENLVVFAPDAKHYVERSCGPSSFTSQVFYPCLSWVGAGFAPGQAYLVQMGWNFVALSLSHSLSMPLNGIPIALGKATLLPFGSGGTKTSYKC